MIQVNVAMDRREGFKPTEIVQNKALATTHKTVC